MSRTSPLGKKELNERFYGAVDPEAASLFKGDGVFLSEVVTLSAEDDLPALLAELEARQPELRDRYVTTFGGSRSAVFSDLVYVQA